MTKSIFLLIFLNSTSSLLQAYDPQKMLKVERYTNPAPQRQIDKARDVQLPAR